MARKNILAGFVNKLEDEEIFQFDISSKNARIKLQKYIYLARKFGFDLNYSFNLYVHGPYSPSLASDYYSLEDISFEPHDINESFFDLVRNKSTRWLELASTIMLVKENYPKRNEDAIINFVLFKKSFATHDEIMNIFEELKRYKVV